MENKPFYEYDLTKEESLSEELERLYDVSHNLENYKTVVYRGYAEDYVGKGFKHFSTYSDANDELNFLIEDWNKHPNAKIGQINLSGERLHWEDYPNILKYIKNKTLELYGEDIIVAKFAEGRRGSIKKIEIDEPLLTIYRKGCVLSKHSDGVGPNPEEVNFFKPANLLLYLNKDYKREWGGCFIVEGRDVVVPEFGKLVFLNFRDGLNPEHEIDLITYEVDRVALLFNTKYKMHEREIWNFE
jgi:hypothetical protein